MSSSLPPELLISPPLLNSACPWATSETDLNSILSSPYTGGATTRTCLLDGFAHDDAVHQVVFFDPARSSPVATEAKDGNSKTVAQMPSSASAAVSSLNSYGYSPYAVSEYITMIRGIARKTTPMEETSSITTSSQARSSPSSSQRTNQPRLSSKIIIISVTGSPEEISSCITLVEREAPSLLPFRVAVEVNLSCPNITLAPPPAYNPEHLRRYLDELPNTCALPIGIKLPPYTYDTQFRELISTLIPFGHKLSFITSTNTLGECLLLGDISSPSSSTSSVAERKEERADVVPLLPHEGFGGMAGPCLHPLALGNVRMLRKNLDQHQSLHHIKIIGVGGVSDGKGYKRMRAAGASAVALATALGQFGPNVFARIAGQGSKSSTQE